MRFRKLILGLAIAFFFVLGLTLQTAEYNPVDAMEQNTPNLEKNSVTAGIAVTSNGAFTAAGFTGAGTEGNPYVLDGATVTTTFGVYGILIQGTTAHFVIQNCVVNLSSVSSTYGIGLESVKNGTILNNDVSGTETGIYVRESEDVNITANTVYNCSVSGINPYLTPGVLVHNNTVTDSKLAGIKGDDIPNGTITSNTIMRMNVDGAAGNSYGITCYGDNLTIKDNEMRTIIKGFGISVQDSANTDIENNLVWQAYFGITGWNAPSITIANNNVSCLEHRGIIVGGTSSNSHVIGNRVYHGNSLNNIGIYFRNSASSGVIESNNVSNFWYGIYLEANAGNNTIVDNNIGWSDLYNGYDDRSTSPKNNWTSNQFSDFASNPYYINGAGGANDSSAAIIVDGKTPTIDSPADIVINDTDTNKWLSWKPKDSYPNVYTLHRNGSPVETDQNWCNLTISFSLDDLAPAVYYYTLYVYDFEWSTTNDFVWVTVLDTSPPVFTSSTSDYSIEVGERVWTNFTATDDVPYLKMAWTDDAGPYWNDAWTSPLVLNWDHVMPSVGVHNYTVMLTDKAGNFAVRTCLVTVVDTTAPTAADFPSDFGSETGDVAWVNFTLDDYSPDTYEIWLDDSMDTTFTFTDDEYISYMVNFTTPGVHNITLVVWDDYVNTLRVTCLVTYEDTTAPSVAGFPADFPTETGNAAWVNFTLNEFSPDTYEIWLDDTMDSTYTFTDGEYISYMLNYATPGEHNVTLVAWDDNANTVRMTCIITYVDSSGPVITGPDDFSYEAGESPVVSWSWTELNPENYTIYENGTLMTFSTFFSGDIQHTLDGLIPGKWNVTIVFYDETGNMNIDEVWVTVSDTTAPTLVGFSNLNVELGNLLQINWTVSNIDSWDQDGKWYVFVNGSELASGIWNSGVIIYDISPNIASYNVTVLVIDAYGNGVTFTTWVDGEDTTNPEISSPDDLTFDEDTEVSQWVNWTCSDLDSYWYEITRNGTIVSSGSWDSVSFNVDVSVQGAGVWIYVLTLEDGSGNTASDEVIVTVNEVVTTTTTTSTTTTDTSTTDTTTPPPDDGGIMMIIVIAGVGGAVIIVIVVLYLKSKK